MERISAAVELALARAFCVLAVVARFFKGSLRWAQGGSQFSTGHVLLFAVSRREATVVLDCAPALLTLAASSGCRHATDRGGSQVHGFAEFRVSRWNHLLDTSTFKSISLFSLSPRNHIVLLSSVYILAELCIFWIASGLSPHFQIRRHQAIQSNHKADFNFITYEQRNATSSERLVASLKGTRRYRYPLSNSWQ